MPKPKAKDLMISWTAEKGSAYLYQCLAKAEQGSRDEALFKKLGEAAEDQAKYWAEELSKAKMPVPDYTPSFRIRMVAKLIFLFGPRALKPILAAMKIRGLSVYLGEVPGFPTIKKPHHNHETQHRAIKNGNVIRAAVFGVNDGLVSNVSLILGIAGASSNDSLIVLTGIAGMAAGALSMATGEYISIRSQRELFEYQIALERAELEEYPEEEAQELSYIYQARGLSKKDADEFALKMLSNKELGLNTLAREELGLDPYGLGSPWGAAISSFLSFSAGGIIPVLPYLFEFGNLKMWISIALTSLALYIVGSTLSLFTGRNAIYSGLRMLFIGILSGAATFAIGRVIGVHI